jgi:hypothetical protein
MKRSWCIVAAGLLVLAAGGPLRADLPGPRRYAPGPPIPLPKPNAVPLVIETRPDVRQARLIVPRSLLHLARPVRAAAGLRPWTLPLTAVALSLAAGGLFLLRGRVRLGAAAVLVLAGAVALSTGWNRTEAANAPPPVELLRPSLPANIPLEQVSVEVVPEGDTVRLLLHPSMLAGLKPAPLAPVER